MLETPPSQHIPVLLAETIELLSPQTGERCLDVTLGLAGHAQAILNATAPNGTLVALDADSRNILLAQERLQQVPPQRWTLQHANFADVSTLSLGTFDIILADLGLSSPHLDDASRGFSFRQNGPLDLRLDTTQGVAASQRIAEADELTLTRVLREFGEIDFAPQLARILVANHPQTTSDLRRCIEQWAGWRAPKVLAPVFQAIRIWVNDELTALDRLLAWIPTALSPGGRAGIISFHSLEDRRVKHAWRELTAPAVNELTGKRTPAAFALLTKHPLRPSEQEITANPRSRSGLLRGMIHLA